MKYTALLMDLDDTLLDFGMAEEFAVMKTMEKYGVEQSAENVKLYSAINKSKWKAMERGEITREQIITTRFGEFFAAVGISADGVRANDDYMQFLSTCGFTMENAVKTCRKIKELGCKIYVITNGTSWIQQGRLKGSPLVEYFDDVFISEDIGFNKPQKEFFDFVLAHIDEKDRSKLLVVGDSLSSDIAGAVNSGIDCCWVNKSGGENRRADYMIKNIAEILDILNT